MGLKTKGSPSFLSLELEFWNMNAGIIPRDALFSPGEMAFLVDVTCMGEEARTYEEPPVFREISHTLSKDFCGPA
jgi:hypothetical protein